MTAARKPVEVTGWADTAGRAPHVFATSAWNGLGATPHQIWAFRRAELAAHAETPFRLADGERATMLHIRTLPPRAQGMDRLMPVLRALLAPLFSRAVSLGQRARVAVVLALSERMASAKADLRRLEAAADGDARAAGLEPAVQVVPRGNAGLAVALPGVCAALAAGRIDAAVVGGIDSCYDAETVDALLADGRLYDGKNLESFIPGEGGAFLLRHARSWAALCAGPPPPASTRLPAPTSRPRSTPTHPSPARHSVAPCAPSAIRSRRRAARWTGGCPTSPTSATGCASGSSSFRGPWWE